MLPNLNVAIHKYVVPIIGGAVCFCYISISPIYIFTARGTHNDRIYIVSLKYTLLVLETSVFCRGSCRTEVISDFSFISDFLGREGQYSIIFEDTVHYCAVCYFRPPYYFYI